MPMGQAGGVAIRPRVTRRSPGDGNKQRGFRQSPMRAPATIVSDQALAIRGGFVVSASPNARIPARSPLSSILCPSGALPVGIIRIPEIRLRVASAAWTRTAGSDRAVTRVPGQETPNAWHAVPSRNEKAPRRRAAPFCIREPFRSDRDPARSRPATPSRGQPACRITPAGNPPFGSLAGPPARSAGRCFRRARGLPMRSAHGPASVGRVGESASLRRSPAKR